ncbi:copper chaperone [Myotisia sp. PD_48]|nr:copper chaperone [Myotisia sp. PD_48]
MIEAYQATFTVPLTCESCIKEVSKPLYELDGIKKVDANLKDQLIFVEGTASPSSIVRAIQSTGRDAILRGSGAPNNASVCILQTHSNSVSIPIRGVARMVQVSNNLTLVDLTINGLSPGKYWASIRETGDISRGPESTGGVWEALKGKLLEPQETRGIIGNVEVNEAGKGNIFVSRPMAVWELIGRSMIVSKSKDGPFKEDDPDTIVGVIARSAGVWDNDKMVCSCTGKNVWEEREEQLAKGMV